MKRIATVILLALSLGCPPCEGQPSESIKSASVYLTAKNSTNRLSRVADLKFAPRPAREEPSPAVYVDSSKIFQTIVGVGGALTDASAETYYKLPDASRNEVLRAYYDPEKGIGYTLGRTSIHSCDFSSESYTYVEPGDAALKSFSIAHDLKYRVPFIKEAMKMTGTNFALYASPWSPPAWMKSNNDILHGGKLKPNFAASWAQYFVQFIKAYEAQGIPIWGLTVQNEPLAVQTWESCIYTAAEERDFLKNDLGPTLQAAGMAGKKIIIWDHNRDLLYERARVVLDDPAAAKFVWGVGFHWYMADCFENVRRVQEAYPDIHLIFTEACNYPFDSGKLQDWHWGENYGRSMIHDFNNGAVGWTDWNVLLDQRGGPNHVGNYCYAPVHADTTTGKLTYMNSFYYIGHFSKFVRPGARRISGSSTADNILTTAFLNADGKISVILMNPSDQSQRISLCVDRLSTEATCPGHSIMTVVL